MAFRSEKTPGSDLQSCTAGSFAVSPWQVGLASLWAGETQGQLLGGTSPTKKRCHGQVTGIYVYKIFIYKAKSYMSKTHDVWIPMVAWINIQCIPCLAGTMVRMGLIADCSINHQVGMVKHVHVWASGGETAPAFWPFLKTHIFCPVHAHLTLRHWVGGVGMLTFMLTCVNGVRWTPRPKVFWSSLVAPWRTVWRCKVEKNTAHLFRNKFSVNYRSSSKNTSNSRGIWSLFWGMNH